MIQESFVRQRLPEKDGRIQKAIDAALKVEGATNIDALNAGMILLVKCLRLYPLGLRESHADQAWKAIIESAFAECLEEDMPEVRS